MHIDKHPSLGRALAATRVQFMVLGMLAGTWGAHIPSDTADS